MDRQRTPNSMCENRTLTTARLERRDKSGSPVAIQALVRTCLSPCRSVGPRAARGHKINNFNEVSGTARYLPRFGSRQ